jgi:hypothetical protein
LQSATPRAGDDAVAQSGGELARAVAAAAVGDDDLVPARAQRRQGFERAADPRRFIQRRDDD